MAGWGHRDFVRHRGLRRLKAKVRLPPRLAFSGLEFEGLGQGAHSSAPRLKRQARRRQKWPPPGRKSRLHGSPGGIRDDFGGALGGDAGPAARREADTVGRLEDQRVCQRPRQVLDSSGTSRTSHRPAGSIPGSSARVSAMVGEFVGRDREGADFVHEAEQLGISACPSSQDRRRQPGRPPRPCHWMTGIHRTNPRQRLRAAPWPAHTLPSKKW